MASINVSSPLFDQAIDHLKQELANLHTGRANPALVEQLRVDYYGTATPLIQLASISTPDAHSIVIQPWDQNAVKDVEKAIHASDLGLNPVNEGQVIRIPIPPLTEDRRKELVKLMHSKIEAARVSIRTAREELWREIKGQKESGDIGEDEMYRLQKELQELVDAHNQTIKELGEKKEQEIMTI